MVTPFIHRKRDGSLLPTQVVVGKVLPEIGDDFVAPVAGQPGFIGPLQQ